MSTLSRTVMSAVRLAIALTALALIHPAAAAEKLTVLLDWYVNPDHAPIVVAKEGGYFARVGLDVDLVVPSDPSAPPRLVAAGQGDVAVTYQPDLMLQLKAGLPLVRFATLVASPLNSLIVLADGPVKTLADLKGRKVGFSIAGFQEAMLAGMLSSAGLSPADVEAINVNFNLVTALASGQVDAIVGGFRNFEPTALDELGKPARVFLPEDNGVPPYDELIFVARNDRRDDPRLKAFVEALREANRLIANQPDEALALMLKAYPDLNDKLNRRAFALTAPLFARDPGALDARRYEDFAAFMQSRRLIDAVPPLADYAIAIGR